MTDTILRTALEQIANHPHKNVRYSVYHGKDSVATEQYYLGCVDGHKCAAKIARKVLEQEKISDTTRYVQNNKPGDDNLWICRNVTACGDF